MDAIGQILIDDISSWPIWFGVSFAGVIVGGLEILSRIIPLLFGSANQIPVKGKHLDKFETVDKAFITFNKILTIVFVYHVIWVVGRTSTVTWEMHDITIFNTAGSLICFYLFYDLLYMSFHRMLHWRSLYPLVHKHHHRQKAPSRGNPDAINVHPFEFLVGEYLHLLTIYVIPCHITAVVVFILAGESSLLVESFSAYFTTLSSAGGIFASLNHTRFDINIPGVYSVKVHDVHHRLPESNYGQYTMFWDKVTSQLNA